MTTDQPGWLAAVVAHIGEPRHAFPDGVRLGDRHRRCWVWFPDGVNHNVAIDRSGRWTEIHAGGKGGHVRLTLADEPTDAQMQAVCTLAGLLPATEPAEPDPFDHTLEVGPEGWQRLDHPDRCLPRLGCNLWHNGHLTRAVRKGDFTAREIYGPART